MENISPSFFLLKILEWTVLGMNGHEFCVLLKYISQLSNDNSSFAFRKKAVLVKKKMKM